MEPNVIMISSIMKVAEITIYQNSLIFTKLPKINIGTHNGYTIHVQPIATYRQMINRTRFRVLNSCYFCSCLIPELMRFF